MVRKCLRVPDQKEWYGPRMSNAPYFKCFCKKKNKKKKIILEKIAKLMIFKKRFYIARIPSAKRN